MCVCVCVCVCVLREWVLYSERYVYVLELYLDMMLDTCDLLWGITAGSFYMGNTKFAVNICKFLMKCDRIVSVLIKTYTEGRPGTSDVNPLCGISGLSFDSPFPFPFSRVRIPAGTAGEFSSPGSTFCADSYFGIRPTPVLPQ